MSRGLLSSLRPYVCKECRARISILPYSAKRFESTPARPPTPEASARSLLRPVVTKAGNEARNVQERIEFHGGEAVLQTLFPRWQSQAHTYSASDFAKGFKGVKGLNSNDEITVYGRLIGRRVMGQQLLFIELATVNNLNASATAQIKLSYNNLADKDNHDTKVLGQFNKQIWRGDWIAVTGLRAQDKDGNLRLDATRLPVILAPSLHNVPEEITDPEFRVRNRHVEHIVHPTSRDILNLRAKIIRDIRSYLGRRLFVEVSTPLLVAGAGGATARPFETVATEFSDTKLSLRVAPELFLKRLILGGMPKVFELGPAFRNEGVDPTHNPEFTICEFYSVMTNLEDLITMTEDLFRYLVASTLDLRQQLPTIPPLAMNFDEVFARLEFIPTLQKTIRERLDPDWIFPDLANPESAISALVAVMSTAGITLPVPLTLPRLLDSLASHFLEPLCVEPTFITHHPECMSPLAKSYLREPLSSNESIRHRVSARAEFFIRSREYVNCYEEENSPVEQRRKFDEQLALRAAGDEEAQGVVDENYVQALTWGMPPTGGWGCGIDRIVMLFGAKSRIADVLPFGNLRNVVGLGRAAVLQQAKAQAQAQARTRRQAQEAMQEQVQQITADTSLAAEVQTLPAAASPPKQAFTTWPNPRDRPVTDLTGNTKSWPSAEAKEIPAVGLSAKRKGKPSTGSSQESATGQTSKNGADEAKSAKQSQRKQNQEQKMASAQATKPEPKAAPTPVMPRLMSFKDLMSGVESAPDAEPEPEHPQPQSAKSVSFKGMKSPKNDVERAAASEDVGDLLREEEEEEEDDELKSLQRHVSEFVSFRGMKPGNDAEEIAAAEDVEDDLMEEEEEDEDEEMEVEEMEDEEEVEMEEMGDEEESEVEEMRDEEVVEVEEEDKKEASPKPSDQKPGKPPKRKRPGQEEPQEKYIWQGESHEQTVARVLKEWQKKHDMIQKSKQEDKQLTLKMRSMTNKVKQRKQTQERKKEFEREEKAQKDLNELFHARGGRL